MKCRKITGCFIVVNWFIKLHNKRDRGTPSFHWSIICATRFMMANHALSVLLQIIPLFSFFTHVILFSFPSSPQSGGLSIVWLPLVCGKILRFWSLRAYTSILYFKVKWLWSCSDYRVWVTKGLLCSFKSSLGTEIFSLYRYIGAYSSACIVP